MFEQSRLLCLLATYQCNAECAHCCIESSPRRKERMSEEEIRSYIDKAAMEPSIKMIVFSGGEATLLGDILHRCLDYIRSKGLRTRIVSNGYWAKSPEAATAVMQRLMDSGLSEINFSLSDYHQPFVPIERVAFAVRAANDLRLPVIVAMPYDARSSINPSTLPGLLGLQPDEVGKIDDLYKGVPYYSKKIVSFR